MKTLKNLLIIFTITMILSISNVFAGYQTFSKWYLNANQVERSVVVNRSVSGVQNLYTIDAQRSSYNAGPYIITRARIYGKNIFGDPTYTGYIKNVNKGATNQLPCSTVDGSGCNSGTNALMLSTNSSYSTISYYWGTWTY